MQIIDANTVFNGLETNLIGAAVMRVLYNAINVLGIPTQLEFAIIGAVILAGVIADEVIRRVAVRRRAVRET